MPFNFANHLPYLKLIPELSRAIEQAKTLLQFIKT